MRKYLEFDAAFAVLIVPFLARFSWITPNLVTFISLLFPLAGAYYLYEGQAALGIVLFCFGRWLDHVDGALARHTDRCTRFGAIFDMWVGFLSFAGLHLAIALTFDLMWLWGIHIALSLASRFFCTMASSEPDKSAHYLLTRGVWETRIWGLMIEDELGSLPYWILGILSLAFGPVLWLIVDVVGRAAGLTWMMASHAHNKRNA